MTATARRRNTLMCLLTLWGGAVAVGTVWTIRLDARPGSMGHPPRDWNSSSRIQADTTRPTLLVFLHPKCPCSRATFALLLELIDRFEERVAVHLVQLEPPAALPSWGRSFYENTLAARHSHVRIDHDPGGIEAKRFGVETSGHVLLFSVSGMLLFSGGITPSRTLAEENQGFQRLIAIVSGRAESKVESSPAVYGCPLETPASTAAAEDFR